MTKDRRKKNGKEGKKEEEKERKRLDDEWRK